MMGIEQLLTTPSMVPAWRGSWARIWLRPDVFSAQEFIVGAMAYGERGVDEFRVLSGVERFGCIYGDDSRSMFDRMLSELRAALHRARAQHLPVAQVELPMVFRVEPVGRLTDQMPGEAVERMLRDGTIPMEYEEPTGKKTRFAARNAEEVVKEVLDRVKVRAGGIDAERFVREDFFADQHHLVGVNLVLPRAAGIVVSGWYAGADRIQLEFLMGASTIEAFAASTNRDRSKSAMFFVRPTQRHGLSPLVWSEVERRLDDLEWQQTCHGLRVVTHDEPDVLAAEVLDWVSTAE